MYYLQSRYYDPAMGRFLNADTFVSTGQGLLGNNMFAYCRNNPVIRIDAIGTNDLCVTEGDDLVTWDDLLNDDEGGSTSSGSSTATSYTFIIGQTGKTYTTTSSHGGYYYSSTYSNGYCGWRVGDDITRPTSAGNTPSWSTVRQRYWKNEAYYNASAYSRDALTLMIRGRAPTVGGYPMELHHPNGRLGSNYWNFYPVTHEQHHFEHYGW